MLQSTHTVLFFCEYLCVGGCDLVIVVDTSKNINGNDFQVLINFVTTVFHSFTLGSSTRYGLAIFGGSVEVFINNLFLLIVLFILRSVSY